MSVNLSHSWVVVAILIGFQMVLVVKNPPVNAGAKWHGFNPWVRKIPWRKKWQPTPVFMPGKFHGQRRLAGISPWDHKELDTTESLST